MFRSYSLGFTCVVCSTVAASTCFGLTTSYTFDAPPDNVLVSIGGSGNPGYPSQLLDGQTAIETLSGVEFNNQLNNTLFIDNNALVVQNASLFDGNYAWADARGNGPSDPAFFEIDFSNASTGVPIRVEYDTAVATSLPALGALVFDTDGDSRDYSTATTPFLFGGGQDNGSQAHTVLTPIGDIDNIARIRFSFGEGDGISTLQFGFDNLLIDTGQSADFGGDGAVDDEDLMAWENAYGSGSAADANGDGDTDGQDYLIWQLEYTGPPQFLAVRAPEPASSVLSLLAIAAVSWAPKRHSR